MKRVLVFLALVGACLPLAAQNIYEFGAVADPSSTPMFKGAASMLAPLDQADTLYSYSTAMVNRPTNGQFTYSLVTGIRRKLPLAPIMGVTLWADAQGGMAASQSATSGAFLGGFVATRPLRPKVSAFLSGKAFVMPVGGGITAQVMAGIQIVP